MAKSAAHLLFVETKKMSVTVLKNEAIFETFYFKCNKYSNFEMIVQTKGKTEAPLTEQ